MKNIDIKKIENEYGEKVDMKDNGIEKGFVLEGRKVRMKLYFDNKSEMKLINEKKKKYKLN